MMLLFLLMYLLIFAIWWLDMDAAFYAELELWSLDALGYSEAEAAQFVARVHLAEGRL